MPRSKRLADEDVVRLAREVILARGTGVSTVEIAAHVGLSQPTLFQRFGDKETLLRRALAADPIAPEAIIGPSDEPERCGIATHVAALASRLYDAVVVVVERTQLASAGGLFAPEGRDRAHAEGGADALIAALSTHLSALEGLRMRGNQATEILLFLVHGAAAMALAERDGDRDAIRERLAASARLALVDD